MKIVIIGGGAHRVLAIMRSAMAVPGVMDGGEIDLFDLNVKRAEAMGRMLLKTPEQAACGCRIKWGSTLDEALAGADVVGVILPAASARIFARSTGICLRNGFISSDNVSPTGAMCGVRLAPFILDVARRMERLCPQAWLIDFANPVAVFSGMVNNHTKIRALGVCAGFTNHLWDIPRIFGRDEEVPELDVNAAGVNHISYILKGNWEGGNLFRALTEYTGPDWKMSGLQPWWDAGAQANITRSVTRLVRFWRELGVLVFSTEGDGMAHLMYEEEVADSRAVHREPSEGELEAGLREQSAYRAQADVEFETWLGRELDAEFWAEYWRKDGRFARVDEDIFVRIFSALAGVKEVKVATSRLNEGAIAGFKDREVVEYSHYLFKDQVRHEGPYDVPGVVQGITAGLAAHQTLLGDALAANDPHMLANALISYPINPYSRSLRQTYKELFALSGDDIAPELRRAIDYL